MTVAADASLPEDGEEVVLALDGVHCAACVQGVQRALAGRVQHCDVDVATRTAVIRHDPRRAPLRELLRALSAAGFRPRRLTVGDTADVAATDARERRRTLARIGVAVIGAMQVMMLAWPAYFDAVPDADVDALLRISQLLIATPVVFWAGQPFFVAALRALRLRTLTMEVPVALSIGIAWAASALRTAQGSGPLYFDTATMFVALLLIGRYLESATRAKAGERLRRLVDSVPSSAQRVCDDGSIESVAAAALRAGDRVRVMPGEALPVDGRLETAAELDEALITGESRPVPRRAGEPALAGSLHLGARPLLLVAQATGEATRVAGILRLLQQAAARKPPIQNLADRVAGHFTLAVLLIAAAGGLHAAPQGVDAALSVVIAVLVASCPCALSLAVPAVLAAATGRLAARGVLVARADRLLRLADVDTVLLDKTGTLTQARLRLERIVPACELSAAECHRIASALESGLPHPVAQALRRDTDATTATGIEVTPGRGVSGRVDGHRYRLGAAEEAVERGDRTLSWVSLSDAYGTPLAHFGLGAPLRDEAPAQVAELRRQGLSVELLTGDSEAAASRVARRVGIDVTAARQSPEDKLQRLRAHQVAGRVVLAVGDGLNDAPFLAAADVSAAMPNGAAAAQARADFVLVNDRLDGIGLALDLGRQARRRVRQNLGWAAAYNLSVLPLAFLGELAPWIAAAGMSLSSLLVVGNALRLDAPRVRRHGIPESSPCKASTC